MPEAVSRILLPTETDELVASALMLYSLPRLQHRVDALVSIPGLGEPKRFGVAIEDWNQRPAARYLLLPGHNTREHTTEPISVPYLQAHYGLRRPECVITVHHAEHTLEQAEWTFEKIGQLGVTSIALYAPAYHLLRAYRTFLQTIVIKGGARMPIIPVPIPNPPATEIPEYGETAWAMVPGEVQRIQTYVAKGDVASFTDFQAYLNWLWEQPLLIDA